MMEEQTEFREELWGGLVDHIRIDEKSSTVVFRGGIEITFFICRNMNWECGMNGFISKPLDMKELIHVLNSVLERKQR